MAFLFKFLLGVAGLFVLMGLAVLVGLGFGIRAMFYYAPCLPLWREINRRRKVARAKSRSS